MNTAITLPLLNLTCEPHLLAKPLHFPDKMSMENCENNVNKRDLEAIDENNGENSSKMAKTKGETEQNGDQNNAKRRITDDDYFRAYAELDIHGNMLSDYVRTHTYRKAIFKNYDKFYGKSVLDVGCGTGILSIFCAQAGAKMVYAVDASNIIEHADNIVKSNNLSDKIQLIKGKMEDVSLPEKVDVIVSEWMGYMLLYETMLPSVLLARDRWLKPGGCMFPERAVLYMAPCSDNPGYDETARLWKGMRELYKVDMSVMVPVAQSQYSDTVSIRVVHPDEVMAHSSLIQSLNLQTLQITQMAHLQSEFKFDCFGRETIHGFVLWFTVTFPGDVHLSTSPYSLETHWQQTVLHVQPCQVHQGTMIRGTFAVQPSRDNRRFLDIQLQYKVGKDKYDKRYLMDDRIR